uniref:G protein-coupled receptor 135 n=1 Tax=Chrysemys picta bellii TaxID=8478 RepID=A0A8C3IFU9_CHRPI
MEECSRGHVAGPRPAPTGGRHSVQLCPQSQLHSTPYSAPTPIAALSPPIPAQAPVSCSSTPPHPHPHSLSAPQASSTSSSSSSPIFSSVPNSIIGGGGGGGSGGEAPAADPAAGAEEAGWSGAALASQALLLVLIFALSALGNGAVVLVIARHRQLRTVTNAFVLSLSLSELLGALLCLPLAFLRLLSRPRGAWLSGRRLCLASAALHAGLGIAATLTMALLAFDRYCAIVRQPRRKMGRRRAAQLLAAVWLAALGFAAPWYLLAQAAGGGHGAGSGRCTYVLLPWGSSRLGPPYSAVLIVLCYLLPFALMCFCHYNICRAVRLSESRVRPLTTYGHLLRGSNHPPSSSLFSKKVPIGS